MSDIVGEACDAGSLVPEDACRLMGIWFIRGWPVFVMLISVSGLMSYRPLFLAVGPHVRLRFGQANPYRHMVGHIVLELRKEGPLCR